MAVLKAMQQFLLGESQCFSVFSARQGDHFIWAIRLIWPMHVVGNELMNYAYWGLEKTIKYHAFCMGPAHFFFLPLGWCGLEQRSLRCSVKMWWEKLIYIFKSGYQPSVFLKAQQWTNLPALAGRAAENSYGLLREDFQCSSDNSRQQPKQKVWQRISQALSKAHGQSFDCSCIWLKVPALFCPTVLQLPFLFSVVLPALFVQCWEKKKNICLGLLLCQGWGHLLSPAVLNPLETK